MLKDYCAKLFVYILGKPSKLYSHKRYKWNYQAQKFKEINERPIEYSFVFKALNRMCPKTVLDVGTGKTALPSLMEQCGFMVTAIDNFANYYREKVFNWHYYVIKDDITKTNIKQKFDFITCISTLEHLHDYDAAIKNMFFLLNPHGYLMLTFPYNDKKYIENVYKDPNASYGKDFPYVCHVFSRNELERWLNTHNAKVIEQEYWQVFTGDFWTFGERIYPYQQVNKYEKHQLTCILIQNE